MRHLLIALTLLLAGCATADRIACVLVAFGSGVQGQPDTSCVDEINARDAGRRQQ